MVDLEEENFLNGGVKLRKSMVEIKPVVGVYIETLGCSSQYLIEVDKRLRNRPIFIADDVRLI